jgi:hypothetical protein
MKCELAKGRNGCIFQDEKLEACYKWNLFITGALKLINSIYY